MYEKLKKATTDHEATRHQDFIKLLNAATASEILGSYYFRRYTTPAALNALKAADPAAVPDAAIIEKISRKHLAELKRYTAANLRKLEEAEATRAADRFIISVEFVRSKTYGHNPHATIEGTANRTHGKASGCGYDKESAAIAEALNANPEIMRALYDYAESDGGKLYGVNNFFGVPYFAGGCGVSCIRDIFAALGYKFEQITSNNTYNLYSIERRF